MVREKPDSAVMAALSAYEGVGVSGRVLSGRGGGCLGEEGAGVVHDAGLLGGGRGGVDEGLWSWWFLELWWSLEASRPRMTGCYLIAIILKAVWF